MYSHFYNIPEGVIHYRMKSGTTKPPVVLLHGTGGHCGSFDFLLDCLENREGILPDMRGHGDSFKPNGLYTTQEYGEDIYQLVTGLGYEKIILGGFSLGALVSIYITASYPELISALMLVDPSIGTDRRIMEEKIRNFEKVPESFKDQNAIKEYMIKKYCKIPEQRLLTEIQQGFSQREDGRFYWKHKKSASVSTFENRKEIDLQLISGVSCPTFIIRAENSKMFSIEHYSKIKNLKKPNFKLVTIDDCDHRILFQKAYELKREIISFLAP